MKKTTEKKIAKTRVLILVFFFLLTGSIKGRPTKKHPVFFETASVGVILKDKTAVWSRPENQEAQKLSEANLGDVFFIQPPTNLLELVPGVADDEGWCKVVFSPGKLGWVALDNIGCQPAKIVNGYVEKEEYDYYKTFSGEEAIGRKTKWDEFYVLKYTVLREGKKFKSCYYVHYYKSSSDSDRMGWVIGQPVCLTYEALYWLPLRRQRCCVRKNGSLRRLPRCKKRSRKPRRP